MNKTLNGDGTAKLDVDVDVDNVVALSVVERIKGMKETANAGTDTSAERMGRMLDTVDLVVSGATIRQCADRHDISYADAREDYFNGMAILNDRTAEAVAAMRDEVTMREKRLIMANMPLALAGDKEAAKTVQQADNILIGLWGLRSARLEVTHRKADDASPLNLALTAYLDGVMDAVT